MKIHMRERQAQKSGQPRQKLWELCQAQESGQSLHKLWELSQAQNSVQPLHNCGN